MTDHVLKKWLPLLHEMAEGKTYDEALAEVTNRPAQVIPTEHEKAQVEQLVKSLPMATTAGQIGFVCADFVSKILEMMGLNPASFMYIEGLPAIVLNKLLSDLRSSDEAIAAFQKSFLEQLSLRG